MFYHPDLIVYLWLLPITLFVIIPASLALCRILMTAVKESPIAEESYAMEQELLAKA